VSMVGLLRGSVECVVRLNKRYNMCGVKDDYDGNKRWNGLSFRR
jgi:hypothetical protein